MVLNNARGVSLWSALAMVVAAFAFPACADPFSQPGENEPDSQANVGSPTQQGSAGHTRVAAFLAQTSAVKVTTAKPVITSFAASPATIAKGQSATLSLSATGATTLSINQGIGSVSGNARKVSPTTTTTYVLTATNAGGSTTASATVTIPKPPTISKFTATPAAVLAGQASQLAWTNTGATMVTLDQGIGAVTGTGYAVHPSVTTTYTLTAINVSGSLTAKVTVIVGAPVINNFWATTTTAGPGIPGTLQWSTTGATSLTIDHGVGTVTGSSVAVSPTATTTYKLTATNAAGSASATAVVNYMPLTTVNSRLFYSEHALFIIPTSSQVTWTGASSWDSVYSTANVNSYVATLKSTFPNDYFFVVVAANNLTPAKVPNVLTYRHLADGIGENTITGVGVPNICRYNIGSGTVIDGAFGVLDHEIGHNWGVFVGIEVGGGHWLANSTATGQMASTYSDDNYQTYKQISGDPGKGFTWTAVDNITSNETSTFSDQDLYLQGFNPTFPDLYVLNSPVYNANHTLSYASVAKYDQAWVEQRNGVRSPTYRTSDKKLRIAVVYVARNLAEVQTVYQPIERSINHFVTAEQIDTKNFRFQVPFLVETRFRASLDARLADLDGNATPTLTMSGSSYVVSSNGSALLSFVAADANGTSPTVSCVPASANCSVSPGSVSVSGLAPGTHFFTLKAQDAGGKKAFAHFVVDVQ